VGIVCETSMRSNSVGISVYAQGDVLAVQQSITTVRRPVKYGESGLLSNAEVNSVKRSSAPAWEARAGESETRL